MAERRRELRIDPEDRRPPTEKRAPERKKSARRGWRWRLVKWGLLVSLWALIALSGVIGWFWLTLPPTSDLNAAERRPSITLLGADGSLLATYGDLFGEPLRLKELPAYLPAAVIATEDRRFYHHLGIDPIGLTRAIYVNFRAGHVVQGGSTITQQLAKNLFLTPERGAFGASVSRHGLLLYRA